MESGKIMKKSIIILGAAASIFALSCQKEPVQNFGSSIIATLEQPGDESGEDSKTVLDANGSSVLWCAGDAIKVFSNVPRTKSNYFNNAKYIANSAGKSVEFTPQTTLSGTPMYAIYPWIETNTELVNDNSVIFKLPDTQFYSENSFGNGASVAFGKFDESGEKVTFKNICGVLRLKLSASTPVKVGKIKLADNNTMLVGKFKINNYLSEDLATSSYGSGGSNVVTLDCGTGVELSSNPTAFNIVVPAGSLSNGFTVKIYDENNKEIKVISTTKNNAPARNQIKSMPAVSVN